MKKIYPNLVQALVQILELTLWEKAQLDRSLERLFKQNRQWGSRDRRWISHWSYFILRHLAWAKAQLQLDPCRGRAKEDLEKIILFFLENEDFEPNFSNFAEQASYPDWLYQAGQDLDQTQWQAALLAMNQMPRVALRANALRCNAQKLQASLAKDKIETEVLGSHALVLKEHAKLEATQAHQKAWFEVQDWHSQQILNEVALAPSDFLIDACAGGGGKSLQAACLQGDRGQILSLDVAANRLGQLRQRAEKAGLSSIKTEVWANPVQVEKYKAQAQVLLLDVPCSGTGVLRRQPERKWQLSPDELAHYQRLQQEILQTYSLMLAPKGRLIYVTCSLLSIENEFQVREFLASSAGRGFVLEAEKRFWPQAGFDGFYRAVLQAP